MEMLGHFVNFPLLSLSSSLGPEGGGALEPDAVANKEQTKTKTIQNVALTKNYKNKMLKTIRKYMSARES